jgi:hypothetical protein
MAGRQPNLLAALHGAAAYAAFFAGDIQGNGDERVKGNERCRSCAGENRPFAARMARGFFVIIRKNRSFVEISPYFLFRP